VCHAQFGPGEIGRTLEGDKVVVRFEDGASRTLLRRFLLPG